MTEIKVAMLGQKHLLSSEGGIENVVKELSLRMSEKGIDVTCLNRTGKHISGKDLYTDDVSEYQGVHIIKVPTLQGKGVAAVSYSFLAALRSCFLRSKIIHFHGEGMCGMIWLPKLFGKKCIVTIHGLDYKRAKWGNFARKYFLFSERNAAKFADAIVVLNKDTQDYFKETYGVSAYNIPNGIKPCEIREADLITQKYNLQKNEYILYLSRIVPEKRPDMLLDAYMQMNTGKKLVIAGGLSDTAEYYSSLTAKAAGNPNIIFTGFVTGKMLEELYSNAYCYVLPSEIEGMPLSLLEAMSYGNCCVVSDIPELKEIINEDGIVLEKNDSQCLKDTLQMLCDHPETVQKYKDRALNSSRKRPDWDEVTDMTIDLYRKVGGR